MLPGLPAQTHWLQGAPWPSGLLVDTSVFDSQRQVLIVLQPTGLGWEVREFNGQSWTVNPAAPFTAGSPNVICYDESRRRIVFLVANQAETWEFDGTRWALMATQIPSPQVVRAATFHHRRGRVMAIAGISSPVLWEWDGVAWTVVSGGAPLPAGYWYDNLAYDAARDRLVVFGGQLPTGTFAPLTVEWDGASGWELVSSIGPNLAARLLTYDRARRVLVLIGWVHTTAPQCWERLGKGTWLQRSTPPITLTTRPGGPVYDTGRRRVLVPYGHLLSYEPVHAAEFDILGPGCPGPLGVPTLSLRAPWSRAWLDDELQVTVRNLPTSTAVMLGGLSDTDHQGLSLPADLSAVGMPGCSLRVAIDDFRFLVGSAGQCEYELHVPKAPTLLGLPYFLQAVALAPGANAAGLVMSDAAEGTVGNR